MEVRQELRSGVNVTLLRAVSIVPLWTGEEMKEAQNSDPDIFPVLQLVAQGGTRPKWETISDLSERSKWLVLRWDQLVLREGLLRRKFEDSGRALVWFQLVLPRRYWDIALKGAHDAVTSGHSGVKRTLERLRAQFWWPQMRDYVGRWVASCKACQRRKGPTTKAKAPLQSYRVGAPGERIASDLMGPFSETDQGMRFIMVMICYFTKLAVAVALPDIQATTVANALLQHWVAYFGVPKELHTDRGSQYEGAIMTELCKLLGITKTRTTAKRPQSDGLAEVLNRTLCDMLKCICTDHPFSWDKMLPMVTMAYNSSVQISTKETQNPMTFGRELVLPFSLLMAPEQPDRGFIGGAKYVLEPIEGSLGALSMC